MWDFLQAEIEKKNGEEMTFREFFEVLENIPAVENVNDFWWGTEWWKKMQQIQNDEKSLQIEAIGMMSTGATETTFNDYRFAI